MRGKQIVLAGSVYARRNGRYTAVTPPLRADDGRSVRRSLGTVNDRDEAVARLRAANLRGFEAIAPLVALNSRRERLRTYLEDWVAGLEQEERAGTLARSTRRDYEQVVRKHIVPDLGSIPLGELAAGHVKVWLQRLRLNGLSDRTVAKAYRCLHRALADSDLPTNPASLPRKDRPRVLATRRIVRPTLDEVLAFLGHVEGCDRPGGHRLHPLWRLLGVTGLRRSEACGLTWDEVRLGGDPAIVLVVRGLHQDGGDFYVARPKSREATRAVSLDAATRDLLGRVQSTARSNAPVKVRSGAGCAALDLVFRWGEENGPMRPDAVSRLFVEEWGHAGLRPGVSLHGLRHCRGSVLLAAGRPVTEVAAELGHSPQVLLQTYGRDLDAAKRHAALAEVTERLYGDRLPHGETRDRCGGQADRLAEVGP
jgi:integrase